MKIEEGTINGKHVFFIRTTKWGKLIFETLAEAKKFLAWFHAREAERQDEKVNNNNLQPPENKEKMNQMTKGDVGVILGDEWTKKNIGTSMIAKLKTVLEPAPQEWIELAQKKLTEKKEKKKSPSSAPSSGM